MYNIKIVVAFFYYVVVCVALTPIIVRHGETEATFVLLLCSFVQWTVDYQSGPVSHHASIRRVCIGLSFPLLASAYIMLWKTYVDWPRNIDMNFMGSSLLLVSAVFMYYSYLIMTSRSRILRNKK